MGSAMKSAIRIADSAEAILQRVESFDQKGLLGNEERNMRAHIGIEPMLLALSMELALKAWFVFDYDTPEVIKSHNLSKLFAKLKQESQNKLASEFRQSIAPLHPNIFSPNFEITDILEHHKDAFVDWRYLHERKSKSFNHSAFIATLEMILSEFRKRYHTIKVTPLLARGRY